MSPIGFQESFGNGPPFAAGSVFGLRKYTIQDGFLRGGFGTIWDNMSLTAACMTTRAHPAPSEGCTCGIYAYWNMSEDELLSARHVFSVVEGYGKVILGTNGFKAQKVRIVALAVADEFETIHTLMDILPTYDVPFYSTISEMLENHPTTQDYYDPSVEVSSFFATAQLTSISAKLDEVTKSLQAVIDKFKGLGGPQ